MMNSTSPGSGSAALSSADRAAAASMQSSHASHSSARPAFSIAARSSTLQLLQKTYGREIRVW